MMTWAPLKETGLEYAEREVATVTKQSPGIFQLAARLLATVRMREGELAEKQQYVAQLEESIVAYRLSYQGCNESRLTVEADLELNREVNRGALEAALAAHEHLKAAAQTMIGFTGHNPYCQLMADQLECDRRSAEGSQATCPGDETHGPCDCGYEDLNAIL